MGLMTSHKSQKYLNKICMQPGRTMPRKVVAMVLPADDQPKKLMQPNKDISVKRLAVRVAGMLAPI
jgi:hypothetical protein